MKVLTPCTQHEVRRVGKVDLSAIGRRGHCWAVLHNGDKVRITQRNYEAIKQAWHGLEDIEEAGLASGLHNRGYHVICALQLGISLETYADWQAHSSIQYQETGKWMNFWDYQKTQG